MTALTNDLIKLTTEAEKNVKSGGKFRQKLHLMPPVGWLNDPNGLCQFKGVYHAFFQYSPFNAEGGVKMWGHYTSRDMIDWEYQGVMLYPDQPFDCSGVYSGCALIEDGEMYLYYTGNVKLEDSGDYDYINTGRQSNTVLVTSPDGIHFGKKQLLMRNSDYPDDLTLHVRDPKVWKEHGTYYMLQGARTKEDVGQAVIFRSDDKINWTFHSRAETEEKFGYMWECPDYFEVDGKKILSASVQGLTGEEWKDRNVYQSGYFTVEGDILGQYSLSDYRLWDYGFDYYAPQSFETEDGRRIQIGWMGMPDCEEYTNPTIENGWQHCFTFPREIFVEDGKVLQRPVRELEEREREIAAAEKGKGSISEPFLIEGYQVYDMSVDRISGNRFRAVLAEELVLEYTDGRFEMRFLSR
ncbi:MAG TPA: glycoside hydrolase family 32 protein, partial [Candidatus Mediterraneibacter gallistercoris]|nr:glycoside hydrolase family 32 protein [Candidatus Mediterraneibacter gallistercoris]